MDCLELLAECVGFGLFDLFMSDPTDFDGLAGLVEEADIILTDLHGPLETYLAGGTPAATDTPF